MDTKEHEFGVSAEGFGGTDRNSQEDTEGTESEGRKRRAVHLFSFSRAKFAPSPIASDAIWVK